MRINFSSIRTQLTFSFLLVALIPLLIIGFYAIQTATNALRQQELNDQAAIVENLKRDIETFFASTKNDIVFLSQSQPLARYLTLRSTYPNSPSVEEARQGIEQEFLAFSRSQGIYYQVRYLDETGQEVVRIERNGLNTQVVAQTQLQNKAHRYYFKDTMQLLDQEIFVSPLELNQEHNQIEVPSKPVIRYATPIYYPNTNEKTAEKTAGIVIINVDANQFLQRLGDALLVDQDGYYLLHPENKRWGEPDKLNGHSTLAQDYPNSAKTILDKTKGVVVVDQVILTFQRVLIPELGYWTLIIRHPTDQFLHHIDKFRFPFVLILIIAVLIALAAALLLNKKITAPIEHLTHIVRQVSAGDVQARAEVKQVDKLGTLSKELNTLLEVINASEKALQKTTQEAEAANLARNRFLAGMSHELRTPLNAIIGYGEMLQEEIDSLGEAELSSDIEKIYSSGKNLLKSINEILDVSKIEGGKMELYTETFYLPNMLDNIVQTIQPLLTSNQETLEVHYGNELGEMQTDLTKLRQILLKLLSNAAQFNKQNGTVSLDVSSEITSDQNEWIIFRIQDHGVGMDEVQKEKLFQRFDKTDISDRSKYDGMGLGFAITSHLISMMGGEINVDSELNKGSTFTVRLPARVTDQSPAQSLRAPHIDGGVLEEGSIVLVIDDEKEVRYVLENYLVKLGYQVETADSGENGYRLAKKLLPDIITLDVMMPKMDGWETLSRLKADPELASIPVIMLSMIENKKVGYALGASDYLTKPITREKLSQVLQKHHFSYHESARLIILIDDDVVNRDMVARMLRKAGWRVCKIEEGRVALNYIQKKRPDLVIVDLQMPEIDGFELTSKLHKLDDSIPIIVLTAKDITTEDRLRLNHVADIFQKGSYSRDELLAKVSHLLSATV
jgi:signal transduction histidine kinase/CheY-like chemotaxis protein